MKTLICINFSRLFIALWFPQKVVTTFTIGLIYIAEYKNIGVLWKIYSCLLSYLSNPIMNLIPTYPIYSL